MKKLLVFGGTTEGREIASRLAKYEFHVDECVATEYGEQVIPKEEHIQVHVGRLNRVQMEEMMKKGGYLAVIDATHPFATEVTNYIKESAGCANLPYFRLKREITSVFPKEDFVKGFENAGECAKALGETTGPILLTTGSKELSVFCKEKSLRERLIVRVLPGMESLRLCEENGVSGRQIIAMQGPFTTELNVALMKQYGIRVLVLKESGKNGGMDEKIEAAAACHIPCFMIKNPDYTLQSEKTMDTCCLGETFSSVDLLIEEILKIAKEERNANRKIRVILAGIGPGAESVQTKELSEILRGSDYLFGAPRMLEAVHAGKEQFPYYLAKDILPCLDKLIQKEPEGFCATVLFSGDSGFFSGCEKLADKLREKENVEVHILPGISSLQVFAAKLQTGWQDCVMISLHGVPEKTYAPKLFEAIGDGRKVFFLTSGGSDFAKIGELLVKSGRQDAYRIFVGKNLTYSDEEICELSASECQNLSEAGLYVGMLLPKKEIGVRVTTPGISDEQFLRGKVPMTKEEVRALSICKLRPTRDAIIYDIGSGTGSVAVELALLSPNCSVYAIETKKEALELIRANCEKFCTENVTVVEALAPEKIDTLPVATHAFIGGSKGNLQEILEALYQKNPTMQVVVNTVSLETISEMTHFVKKSAVTDLDITTISVVKVRELGAYHLGQAGNPVTIFSFRFAG